MKNLKKYLPFIFLALFWNLFLPVIPASSSTKECRRIIDGTTKVIGTSQPLHCQKTIEITSELYKSFYKYGFTYEESQNPINEFFNLFGISFKKGLNLSYPDQRIAYDGHHLWKTFNILMEEQFLPISIYTNDINNGYTGSIGGSYLNTNLNN